MAAIILVFGTAWCVATARWPAALVCGALFAAAGAVGLLVQRATSVDSSARVVCLRLRLFDYCPLWTRRWPFEEFDAVVRSAHTDIDTLRIDSWLVGLRRRSGRIVWVRYENVAPDTRSAAIDSVAQELAAVTGLPICEVGE